MKTIRELKRFRAPVPKPQGLAAAGGKLWIGARDTKEIVRIDIAKWVVEWSVAAPGIPWGLAVAGTELRAVLGEPPDDSRFIRKLIPGTGFDERFRWPCPDDSGSHLSWTGRNLTLSQWYPKKLLVLSDAGKVERVLQARRGICGHTFADGSYYLVTTDAEETNDYWLTRLDPAHPEQSEDIAKINFQARALAFDGQAFWTNHREAGETVQFVP
jgi:hypothetical protein